MKGPLSISLPKKYDPTAIEREIYRFWEQAGCFVAAETSDKPAYCIVLPPPNVTGALHMGHALIVAIQDLLIRWRRMQGHNTLWLPGTDHAGIATQMVVERQLRNEGKSRHDLGREKFLERVWEWKTAYGGRITEQHKRLGASLDWTRERFTMDEGLSRAVREAFVRLYEAGKISRDKRLINWCTSCRTALSDVEVDRDEPETSELWSFAYPLTGGGEIVVATTRPETMLGDTAVVVHPDDVRYKDLIGKMISHPFQERSFPVVADDILADPELGTGAVKVTPAHDPNDFECGARHQLDFIDIFNDDGTVNDNGTPFAGLDRFEAREKVKQALTEMGLFRGRQDHAYAPGRCSRCRSVVEPKLSTQWFVDTGDMAEAAMQAVRDDETKFVPKHQEHRYFEWLEKKLPWCISRQLWWGHRIPAWYCDACEGITVSRTDPTACQTCGSSEIHQDEDVLDTWFSSALWPFSTLGWPDDTADLSTFYPTSVLETGYDITTFWVSRMMIMGLALMGEKPFHHVLLHPMIRDQDGNKMSKSRGNVIDPLDVIEGISLKDLLDKTRGYTLPQAEIERAEAYQSKHFPQGFPACGTDALRFTLAAYTGQDQDIRFSVDRVAGYRKFGNKIWQAVVGFALPHLEGLDVADSVPEPMTLADRWILSRTASVAAEVGQGLETFRVGDVTQVLYHFFWDELCSWYIEFIKPVFTDGDGAAKVAGKHVLRHVLDVSLRLLHPFMPFITEALWQVLHKPQGEPESIAIAPFPTASDGRPDKESEDQASRLMGIISAVRGIRADYNVAPATAIPIAVYTDDAALKTVLDENNPLIASLARVDAVDIAPHGAPRMTGAAMAAVSGAEVLVPLKGIVDIGAERARLLKEKEKTAKTIAGITKKLENKGFLNNAPEAIVAKEREKQQENSALLVKIEEALDRLKEVETR
ncbi:MAG: valine--tRNA ligase [Myxococcota bacterium]|nr:valine--tRNA ligase [Myxococcota bacterium]